MAHISLPPGVPGIIGLLKAYPDTDVHLSGLAEVLLCGPSSLTRAERETIAAYVSSGNQCTFCMSSHAAAARHLWGARREVVQQVLRDAQSAPVSEKMMALLIIADKVRRDGRLVTAQDVQRAREAGADDKTIHDTVLIAAAFCMYNRYVDGLATWTPDDPTIYDGIGAHLAANGYVASQPEPSAKRQV